MKNFRSKPSKYRNRKVTVNGMTFDSKKEYERFCELSLFEKAGTITDLQRQVRFRLLPSQRRDGKVIERPCDYIADFTYKIDGKLIVEDTKGMKTLDYIIKRKLMLYIHDIIIREV